MRLERRPSEADDARDGDGDGIRSPATTAAMQRDARIKRHGLGKLQRIMISDRGREFGKLPTVARAGP